MKILKAILKTLVYIVILCAVSYAVSVITKKPVTVEDIALMLGAGAIYLHFIENDGE